MKRFLVIIIAVAALLCSCSPGGGTGKVQFYAMDTYMTVTVYGENAEKLAKKAEKRVHELDSALTAVGESSELCKLNKSGSAVLGAETYEAVSKALRFYNLTDGAFNPALFPLTELWGFSTGNYRVPSDGEIKKALALTDADTVKTNEKTHEVNLGKKGMRLDLGGIGKGYTSSVLAEMIKSTGSSAIINLGGNVQTVGKKPDGSDWRVAVEHPDSSEKYLGTISVDEKAVITSGGYERNFTENGKTYHHILDPETGKPAESGLKSVTICSPDGTLADALSTALFVMGEKKAVEFWRRSGDFGIILFTDDDRLIVSEDIAGSFSSDMNFETVRR